MTNYETYKMKIFVVEADNSLGSLPNEDGLSQPKQQYKKSWKEQHCLLPEIKWICKVHEGSNLE